jgi:hypothetical protein
MGMLIGGAPDKASPSLLDAGFLAWRPMALHPNCRTTFGIGQGLPVPVLYYLWTLFLGTSAQVYDYDTRAVPLIVPKP